MDDSPERAFLAQLEDRLAEGNQVDVEVSLVLLAGRGVDLDEDELRAARRRAVQLLAAGGDPHRDLDPEGRAVTALAEDLNTPERRAALESGLESLRPTVDGLAHVSARLERLADDDALAWRWFSCTLLGEVLVED
jgi:hypothetical protein